MNTLIMRLLPVQTSQPDFFFLHTHTNDFVYTIIQNLAQSHSRKALKSRVSFLKAHFLLLNQFAYTFEWHSWLNRLPSDIQFCETLNVTRKPKDVSKWCFNIKGYHATLYQDAKIYFDRHSISYRNHQAQESNLSLTYVGIRKVSCH